MNLFLIPRWSYTGAAAATIATEAFMAVGLWLQIRACVRDGFEEQT